VADRAGTLARVDPLYEFALSVKAIERELTQRINEAMQPLGITAAQADALVVIAQAEPVSLKELGELLIAEGGHPSRLVDRLVESGLVQRRPAKDDKRRHELSLTARGRRLEKRVAAARQGIMDLARQLVPEGDVESAMKVLRELIEQTQFADLIERRVALDREHS